MTNSDRRQLRDALLDAFPTRRELLNMLEHSFGDYSVSIPVDQELHLTVGILIEWAELEIIRLKRLIEAALSMNQGNTRLLAIYERIQRVSRSANLAEVSMTPSIRQDDINTLVNMIAKIAAQTPPSPQHFLRNLVNQADLPDQWVSELSGIWSGNAPQDARTLVKWALARDVNPNNRKYTTLGSILSPLLQEVGFEDAATLVAMIWIYRLYRDAEQIDNLAIRYQVPLQATGFEVESDIGPELDWGGPTDTVELQSFFQPELDFQDVGFLKQAIERASSVCLLRIPNHSRTGTGFLVAKNLLLTNYHLLKGYEGENVEENARQAILHFGYFTEPSGTPGNGQTFKLDPDKPILKLSPISQLDYVLLKVEDTILQAKDIQPTPYAFELPKPRSGLSILQHPQASPMKLVINPNGVTGVYPARDRIQYVTTTKLGSSGAPCFNHEWKVVALHHVQRGAWPIARREGILFSSIYEEIKEFLPQY